MILRILASVLLLFSVLFLPFWVSAILAIAGMVYFRSFWEAIAILLVSDLLYGMPEARYLHFAFISFILAVIAFTAIGTLKKRMKFYR